MLLDKIYAECKELNEIIGDDVYFLSSPKLITNKERISETLLLISTDMRKLSRIETILENKSFSSRIVQDLTDDYMYCIRDLFKQYDGLIERLSKGQENPSKSIASERTLFDVIIKWREYNSRIKQAGQILLRIIEETWEPLPDNKEEDNVSNIIISSETRSMSLNGVANDVDNLDRFFNSICMLINQDEDKGNNIYLRKVETGSLTVAVSCAMEIGPIIGFIFMCIKLCQKAEKRHLDNEKKRLELINDSMHIAKKS